MNVPRINEIFFEYLAYWESGLQASRLAKILGQSREHVQRNTISRFERTYRVRLINSQGRMRKLADTSEGLRFAPSRPSDLVRMLDGISILFQNAPEDYPLGVRVESPLHGLMPEPDAEVFRALYAACTHKCAVRMQYHSKQGVFPMTFSPHALVQVPDRVHFRGYAQWAAGQEKGMFIDLVPARVESIEGEMIWDAVPSSEDADWHSKSSAVYRLSSELPEAVAAVLRQEWASSMTDNSRPDTMVIPSVRKAVKPYVDRALRYRWFGEDHYEAWIPRTVE